MMRVGSISRRVVSPLQFLIILQLKKESKYGYQILKTLKEEFEGIWELKTGTFYPAIRSLETRGFVKTELKEEKEFYSLTEKGDTLLMKLGERFEHEYKILIHKGDLIGYLENLIYSLESIKNILEGIYDLDSKYKAEIQEIPNLIEQIKY